MKKTKYILLIISTISIAVLAFAIVIVLQSGLLRSKPRVEVSPDNCYRDTLRVITDLDYSPYSFYEEDGSISGYDIELITLVANRLHMNLDIRMLEWQEAIRAMLAGEADILMTCDYSNSFTGVEQFEKSTPTSSDAFAIYSKHRIKSISQMVGKRIAIMEQGNVTPQMEKMGLLQFCTGYKDNRQVMQALIDGDVEFAVMRQMVGTMLLYELGNKDAKAYLSAGLSSLCWAVSGADPELTETVNTTLNEIKMSGLYDQLGDKWLTTFVKPYTVAEVVSKNTWVSVFFLFLVALSIVIILSIKQGEYEERIKREKEHQAIIEAANKSKTDFLFNMSHDIRTPMNAIIGFTDMAKKYIDDKERVSDCLDKIEHSGSHLLELINEVLDMSRIEAGKLRSEKKVVNVAETAAGLVNICHETSAQRQVSLTFEDLGIRHQYVNADQLHVNQIIMNILGNAIKYTQPGGSVRYTAYETDSYRHGYGIYVFCVEDTGIGMSKEFLTHLFDSFSREENVMTSEIQGTGLGMAIVKRLVDFLGGTIAVESERGKGTKVTVTLPLEIADEPESSSSVSKQEEAHVNIAGRKILLVEDNELNREIASVILEEKGAVVEQAVNGADAVEHIREKGAEYYCAVLMDIQMPVMNGYEATREIRKLPGTQTLPIIALSANAFEEDRQRSIDFGMNDHVAKPIDIDKLLSTLARYL